jgi:hypothetical protein
MPGWMEGRALQARVPGGSTKLLEETEVSSFVPVLNLAILPFLEVSRELLLVRQKRSGRRLLLPRFPCNLLEGRAILARTGVSRGVLLTRARAVLAAAKEVIKEQPTPTNLSATARMVPQCTRSQ